MAEYEAAPSTVVPGGKSLTILITGNCRSCGEDISRVRLGGNVDGLVIHAACFKCNECGGTLDFKAFYDIGGKPYCNVCYETKVSLCQKCGFVIVGGVIKTPSPPGVYHPDCFRCSVCNERIMGSRYKFVNGTLFCAEDYHQRYSPRCGKCGEPIAPSPSERIIRRITVMDKNYHEECFTCQDCNKLLQEGARSCFPFRGRILCEACHLTRVEYQKSPAYRRSLHERRYSYKEICEIIASTNRRPPWAPDLKEVMKKLMTNEDGQEIESGFYHVQPRI